MTTYTYTAKIEGVPHTFTMAREDAERVVRAIRHARNIGNSWRELTGVLGVDEREDVLMAIGGNGEGTIANPEKHAADIAALLADLPEHITKDNMQAIVERANQIAAEHLPVVDKRKTPEQHAAEVVENETIRQQLADKDEQARLDFAAKYAESSDLQPTPEGMQAVTLELNYDDSDPMTDYFNSHHSYGQTMVIGYVPKGAKRTEANARAILAKYPDLARLNWTWHKEDYSMGHGYWLRSENVTQAEGVRTYGRIENPPCWWEIQFDGGYSAYRKGYLPYKGFSQANARNIVPESASQAIDCEGFEVTYERDWTWIKFPAKPDESVIAALHCMGARFSGRRMAWYITHHVEAAAIRL